LKQKNIYKKAKKIRKEPDVFSSADDITFFEKVYQVARLIPKGRVTSYGAIARYLGAAGSSRMVGWAMNAAKSALPPVPAQRVVNRNGLLTGKHHFGNGEMERLLKKEGIKVEDDKIVSFHELFWDPAEHLQLE
jgi:methylated-DNA-protein-cysteine methyltransferase-like protein